MSIEFKPDTIRHLNHYRERTQKIKYIIIHCSRSTPDMQWENLDKLKLSAHYIIGRNGYVIEALPPEKVGYHAGISKWKRSRGQSLNGTSIGIELEAPSMGQDKKDYTIKQINKLTKLLQYLMKKYKIQPQHILAHSDIAPERKPDPGICFPWQKLSSLGITVAADSTAQAISQKNDVYYLKYIGYNTTNIAAARYAFCRRWLPQEVKIEKNIQYLLDNPYPKNFRPKNFSRYLKRLAEVLSSYQK